MLIEALRRSGRKSEESRAGTGNRRDQCEAERGTTELGLLDIPDDGWKLFGATRQICCFFAPVQGRESHYKCRGQKQQQKGQGCAFFLRLMTERIKSKDKNQRLGTLSSLHKQGTLRKLMEVKGEVQR